MGALALALMSGSAENLLETPSSRRNKLLTGREMKVSHNAMNLKLVSPMLLTLVNLDPNGRIEKKCVLKKKGLDLARGMGHLKIGKMLLLDGKELTILRSILVATSVVSGITPLEIVLGTNLVRFVVLQTMSLMSVVENPCGTMARSYVLPRRRTRVSFT